MGGRGHVYMNGRIIAAEEAAISPFDVGILRGYAVFDLLQTVDGEPFQLREHLERFRASAAALGLEVPASDAEISSAILRLLELNDFEESLVRLVLTGGESDDGMHFDPATPTFFIITHERFSVPARFYEDGAKLVTSEYQRELPEAKTTNYITWLRNHGRLDEAGAIDVLYHVGGRVSEAATASFYIVRDNKIHAPGEGVLRGTVGQMVLEFAENAYEIVRGPFTLDEVLTADEAFITSSVRGVVPIVRIDETPIGDGTVGPVAKHLMAMCRREMQAG